MSSKGENHDKKDIDPRGFLGGWQPTSEKRICGEIRRKRSPHRAVEPMTVIVIMKMKGKKKYCVS
jgi:hypothetical protein